MFPKLNSEPFIEKDPFNNNIVEGLISRATTEYYGALYITKVNGTEVTPQTIMCTPKLKYPFDKNGKYHFPKAKEITIWEKLDGTNILGFRYKGADREYISFKTRLRPFLGESKYGNFYELWKEMLAKYDIYKSIRENPEFSLSFELYGTKNRHLILYNTPIDIALLFGVSTSGEIVPPHQLKTDLPLPKLYATIDRDYVWNYEELQRTIGKELVMDEDGFIGSEGAVWYLTTTESVVQYKCKPEAIEKIHWANPGIEYNALLTTCWNVFESNDELTYETLLPLLQEEYTQAQIDFTQQRIGKAIIQVNMESLYRKRIQEIYSSLTSDEKGDKAKIMRAMSKFFPKDKMRKVFSWLEASNAF